MLCRPFGDLMFGYVMWPFGDLMFGYVGPLVTLAYVFGYVM